MIKNCVCEKCGESFEDEKTCLEHEINCEGVKHRCKMCGKQESLNKQDVHYFTRENMWHKVDLGEMGYGSILEGEEVKFEICDTCLGKLVLFHHD